MKNCLKFAALQGVLALAAGFLGLLFLIVPGTWQRGDTAFLLASLLGGCLLACGPVLASKWQWLSFAVSKRRAFLAGLPLPFLGLAFLFGMAGWGDPQEHLIRGALHILHREMTDRTVGSLIVCGIFVAGAVGVSGLLWLSLSILTKRWRGQVLVIVFLGCLVLCGLFWSGLFLGNKAETLVASWCAIFVAIGGCLFGLAIEMNATSVGIRPFFRTSVGLLLVGIVCGSVALYAGSVPAKKYPSELSPSLWTFDISSTGCRPAWGGPDSSQAVSQIEFIGDKTLAMAIETYVISPENNKFESKSCVFTIDVSSGKLMAQTIVDGERPMVRRREDGNFSVVTGWKGASKGFTPELKPVEDGDSHQTKGKFGTAGQFGDFRTEQNGNLWFTRGGKEVLLANYGGSISLQPLGESRMLVLASHQSLLYSTQGELIAKDSFTREGIHFAGVSADHKRFALSVYLWGVGDPSYLEEERIVAYDCQSGSAIASVKANPLPRVQSWTALSPDGELLLVGAEDQLRLFRIPTLPTPLNQR